MWQLTIDGVYLYLNFRNIALRLAAIFIKKKKNKKKKPVKSIDLAQNIVFVMSLPYFLLILWRHKISANLVCLLFRKSPTFIYSL